MTMGDFDVRYAAHYPVAVEVVSVVVALAGTAAETDVGMNGIIKQIHFIVPDLDDTDTAELLLHDADNRVLYASGEKAESTSHVINVERAVTQPVTFRVECSGDQVAARTFTVVAYYV